LLKRPCVLQRMLCEDVIVIGSGAAEKMTWLNAYHLLLPRQRQPDLRPDVCRFPLCPGVQHRRRLPGAGSRPLGVRARLNDGARAASGDPVPRTLIGENTFATTDGHPKKREHKFGRHRPLGACGALTVSNYRRYRWHSAVMHVVQSSSQPSHCFEPCVST